MYFCHDMYWCLYELPQRVYIVLTVKTKDSSGWPQTGGLLVWNILYILIFPWNLTQTIRHIKDEELKWIALGRRLKTYKSWRFGFIIDIFSHLEIFEIFIYYLYCFHLLISFGPQVMWYKCQKKQTSEFKYKSTMKIVMILFGSKNLMGM